MNLLYGTSFSSTGIKTTYDRTKLTAIVSATGYNQDSYLQSLQAAAGLYRSLQANTTLRQEFNRVYKTYLPPTGSPRGVDTDVLFRVVGQTGYNQANFLTELNPVFRSLYQALLATPARFRDMNLLYGTSFSSTGIKTTYDRTKLAAIVSAAGYNQAAYLKSLEAAAGLYRTLQANSTLRQKFNQVYKTYLPATGTPRGVDTDVLFRVVSQTGYEQAKFLSALGAPAPAPVPTPTPTPTPVPTPTPTPVPTNPDMLFSPNSFWNTKLAADQSVNLGSNVLVNDLIAQTKLASPWINTTAYSTPVYKVDSNTPKVPVAIVQGGVAQTGTALYAASMKGVPIPANAIAAAGTDGHITILYTDLATGIKTLYEYWQLRNVNGQWQASWGGIIENYGASNGIMPVVKNQYGGDEYWGATATGLPVAGGTIMLKELEAGVIPHVLAFAIPNPKNTFVSPANRTDGTASGVIPEGTVFRLPANFVVDPSLPPMIRMMLTAIRDYGMVLRDKSGAVTFYGEDPRVYGDTTAYNKYYGGMAMWDMMKLIPWSQLRAIN
ncbi:MAG: hypothetical protein HY586_04200 [Candidatus Omnitrophica bacterium]|nr:hypothetical protein [Candidatus Omnitrophota bacterium]